MAALYRKKPIMVEAMCWNGTLESATEVVLWLRGLGGVANYVASKENSSWDIPATILVHTLEGDMHAKPGDYVIRGIKGEFYPIDGEIFRASYDPINHLGHNN